MNVTTVGKLENKEKKNKKIYLDLHNILVLICIWKELELSVILSINVYSTYNLIL